MLPAILKRAKALHRPARLNPHPRRNQSVPIRWDVTRNHQSSRAFNGEMLG